MGVSRGTCVAMMQSANLRDRDDPASRRRLHHTRRGRVAIQRQMATGVVIVVKVFGEDTVQVPLVEHDDMIQAVTTNTANTERDGGNREEVADGDVTDVIVQKSTPGLRRRFSRADHVLGHGCFHDVVAQ